MYLQCKSPTRNTFQLEFYSCRQQLRLALNLKNIPFGFPPEIQSEVSFAGVTEKYSY